jgi:hypothetical protein
MHRKKLMGRGAELPHPPNPSTCSTQKLSKLHALASFMEFSLNRHDGLMISHW